MANERNTENLVRKTLAKLGYYDDPDIEVEEQQSKHPDIDKLLKNASKKGLSKGYPEFIIRSKTNSTFIIVVECKAKNKFHQSEHFNKYADYAVDGVLLYGSFLARGYDVLCIAVSGETVDDLKISHFLIPKEQSKYNSYFGGKLLTFSDYYNGYKNSDIKFNQDYGKLLSYASELNSLLHSNKIKESQRSLLISGILISLGNDAFKNSYASHKKAEQICASLINTVANEFSNADIPEHKIIKLKQAYSFIQTNTTLTSDREFFVNLINSIDKNINGFMRTYKYFDTIGQFYIEFLSYANNDKGLGIVLTPPHITDIFCDLAAVDKDSVVFDNCCGTGGFLISAMKRMIKSAKSDKKKITAIQKSQLFGIEFQDDIYALGISNMILHGDGKSNFLLGDSFQNSKEITKFKPTVGFLNPPYKSEKTSPEELAFVLTNLATLEKGGICVSIIPFSCVIAKDGDTFQLKLKIMENHTVEAVMSMPDDLFHNSKVTVPTCILVITAHTPHPKNKKTWLGYWRHDGFEKHKIQGRIDSNNKWEAIREKWLVSYLNRELIDGLSLTKELVASDEWCAEAYMVTDYSKITKNSYLKIAKQYLSFRLLNDFLEIGTIKPNKPTLHSSKLVKVEMLFEVKSGISKSGVTIKEEPESEEDIRFVRPSKTYQGSIDGFIDKTTVSEENIYPDGTLYVSTDGQGSHTYSYVSSFAFTPNSNVSVLIPKRDMCVQEKLYYALCITANRYKYSYGRKPKGYRLKELLIPEHPAKHVYGNIFGDIFDDWKTLIQ